MKLLYLVKSLKQKGAFARVCGGGCKKKQLSLIRIEIYPLKLVCVRLICDFLYKYYGESDVFV